MSSTLCPFVQSESSLKIGQNPLVQEKTVVVENENMKINKAQKLLNNLILRTVFESSLPLSFFNINFIFQGSSQNLNLKIK